MGEYVAKRMEYHCVRWNEQASLCHNTVQPGLSKQRALPTVVGPEKKIEVLEPTETSVIRQHLNLFLCLMISVPVNGMPPLHNVQHTCKLFQGGLNANIQHSQVGKCCHSLCNHSHRGLCARPIGASLSSFSHNCTTLCRRPPQPQPLRLQCMCKCKKIHILHVLEDSTWKHYAFQTSGQDLERNRPLSWHSVGLQNEHMALRDCMYATKPLRTSSNARESRTCKRSRRRCSTASCRLTSTCDASIAHC